MVRLRRPVLSPVYAILDAGAVRAAGRTLTEVASALRAAGVSLVQYRDKQASPPDVLANAREVAAIFSGTATLILNDSPELCVAAGWDGVHVGQSDGSVERARAIVGGDRIVGVSTHDESQVRAADASDADYVAVGPVYATQTKMDTEPEVGLGGVTHARLLTSKPLVAIGGISYDRLPAVLAAGADSVAVIGALLLEGASIEDNARRMLELASR